MKLKKNWNVLGLAVTLVLTSVNLAFGENTRLDLNKLMNDTQKVDQNESKMRLIWWIPEDYWKVVQSYNSQMTPQVAEELAKITRPYIIIAVTDGKMGVTGGVTYKSEATIRATTVIKDSQGNSYHPIEDINLSPDAKNLKSMLKPLMENSIGQMGKNLQILFFPAKSKTGAAIADPHKEGSFSVIIGDFENKWNLPLQSLLPSIKCPTCGESLNGAFKYCPWDGTKLKTAE